MPKGPFFYSVLSGLFYAWPLITRRARIPEFWTAVAVMLGTMFIMVIWARQSEIPDVPPAHLLSIALLGGIANGLGFWAYTKSVATNVGEVSRLGPISAVTLAFMLAVGGMILYREPLTLKKTIGMIGAPIIIWLLGS